MIKNAMTIDVEDYFQVSAFETHIKKRDWDAWECRVVENVDKILFILSDHQIHATFFILGWIAKKHPHLVKKIAEQGHEIASHGDEHDKITTLTPEKFLIDIKNTKLLLEDISGSKIKGYRAPSFSIDESNFWAFDCLAQAGYLYSSSTYPISHDHYGIPDGRRFCFIDKSGIMEIPISTSRILGCNFPASGGGYFRLLPYGLSRWLFSQVNVRDKEPVIFYFHPWEIDLNQPKIKNLNIKTRFRHYINISRMETKLIRLFREFHWGRMDEIFLNAVG